ncbi:cupin domain-containing protein [Myxococcota bacterium]|nr:cupin domain-containing protein [Myxococcota bacterium]
MLVEVALPLLLLLGPAKPTQAAVPVRGAIVDRASQPVFVQPGGTSGARVLLDGTTAPGLKEAAMTELVLLPGTSVPEHVHDQSAELLYILEGEATMTLDGETQRVRAGMAIYIPAGVKHSVKLESKLEPLRALQVYTPGGPEQRFKKGEPTKE